jgi:Zn-finger nucleic acid-binding protein
MLLCPTCMIDLHIAKRQDVEIDHCPQCRGVWLNRGELDKIIERTIEVASPRRRTEGSRFSREDRDEDRDEDWDEERSPRRRAEGSRFSREDRDEDWDEERRPKGKHRRRESWLGELFDFG